MIYALIAGFLHAGGHFFRRHCVQRHDPISIARYSAVGSVCITSVIVLIMGERPLGWSRYIVVLSLLVGLFNTGTTVWINRFFVRGTPSFFSAMSGLVPVWTIIFGLLGGIHTLPSITQLSGVVCIVIGVIILSGGDNTYRPQRGDIIGMISCTLIWSVSNVFLAPLTESLGPRMTVLIKDFWICIFLLPFLKLQTQSFRGPSGLSLGGYIIVSLLGFASMLQAYETLIPGLVMAWKRTDVLWSIFISSMISLSLPGSKTWVAGTCIVGGCFLLAIG